MHGVSEQVGRFVEQAPLSVRLGFEVYKWEIADSVAAKSDLRALDASAACRLFSQPVRSVDASKKAIDELRGAGERKAGCGGATSGHRILLT
jgi:hypothetical protein